MRWQSFLPVAETWDFILESGALYLCGGIAFISLGFGGPFTYDVVRHVSTIELDTILMRPYQKTLGDIVLV